jgi:four helix bundle protein
MKNELKNRTKKFALEIIKLSEFLPNNQVGFTITNQIIRSGTAVAANYRAVCRAKSDKDFISKMETVIEEADETLFWLELIADLNLIDNKDLSALLLEADELTAIFVSSVKTIKNRVNSQIKIPKSKIYSNGI